MAAQPTLRRMAVVTASNLRKEIAGSLLFQGVSFSVERRDRLSLSGPNGAGKTTLLRMLARETDVHGGELAFAKGTRMALHDQRPPLQHGLSLREYALSGARDLVETEEELRSLEQAMAGGEHGAARLRRYSEAQARLEHAGGYDWRERAAGVLRGLGFIDADLDRPLETFSGGELTRASLARALAGDPDLLLLDEPTNHLDVENLEWLEQELQSLDAAVILVAHDRWFLEAVTTAVLELEAGRSLFFAGPWHVWRREKAARAAAAARTAERVGVDIARPERLRQDDAAGDDPRRAGAGRRNGSDGLRRRSRVLLAARGRAGRARQRARLRPAGDRPEPAAGSVAARPLPLLRLGSAREAGRRALRRRAKAAGARARRRVRCELPRARRADEPSRPREPRGTRRSARRLSGNGAARLARPRAARRSRHAPARDRAAGPALVRRRLGRLRAGADQRAGAAASRAGRRAEAQESTRR